MLFRKKYVDKITRFKDQEVIKIISGVRRCGKSIIMKSICMEYQKADPKANIIYIDFELFKFDEYKNYKAFYQLIATSIKPGKNYLFVDEIQVVEKFEVVINAVAKEFDCDIYITGSNAYLLSSEIATLLSGRYIEFEIFPFSYSEYLSYKSLEDSTHNLLNYLEYGGMPTLIRYADDKEAYMDMIDAHFDSIIVKDIVRYNKNVNELLLRRIFDYLIDNVSNEHSLNSITNYLNKDDRGTNNTTNINRVTDVVKSMQKAFIFYQVRRYNIRGKKLLTSNDKFYLVDPGFRNLLQRGFSDIGRVIENIVYLELRRLGFEVFVGKIDKREVDFVCKKHGTFIYVQVAYKIESISTLEREPASLELINDNYNKYIISMDEFKIDFKNGIKHLQLNDFLINGFKEFK